MVLKTMHENMFGKTMITLTQQPFILALSAKMTLKFVASTRYYVIFPLKNIQSCELNFHV